MKEVAPSHGVVRFSSFEVDLRNGEVRKHGFKIRLQDQPFHILQILLEHPGELVTREELQRQIWPADTFVDFEKGLNNAIKRLRDALGDSAEHPRFIETHARHGYRFIGSLNGANGESLAEKASVAPVEPVNRIQSASAVLQSSVTDSATGTADRKWWMSALAFGVFAAVLTLGGYVIDKWWKKNEARPPADRIRVVVLPFQNLSGDPSQDFFSSGLTDELITQLARLNPNRLGVIASASSNIARGKPISEIARTLNVQYVVEGTVRRSGEQVRIDVQLIQTSDETHIWANSYTRDLSDVLRAQSEVAEAVGRQIPANLHLLLLPQPPSVNPQAHDAYLKGKLYWNSRTDIGKSVAFFEEAIKDDPNYAAAYAGLADAYVILGNAPYDGILPREANRKARAAAQRALELDPSLAEAHAALGSAAMDYAWDMGTAEREYRLALELNPNDPSVHEWLGLVFMVQGKTKEALEEGRRCLDFDPVSPAGHTLIAEIFYFTREYDKVIEEAHHILEVQPQYLQARYFLGSAYLRKKMYAEAIEQFRLAREASGDNAAMVMAYGYAQGLAGNFVEARAALQELEARRQKRYVPAMYFAGIYLGLNDTRQAVKYLNEAYEERCDRLIYLGLEPMANSLRSDPEFQTLLHKVGVDTAPTK